MSGLSQVNQMEMILHLLHSGDNMIDKIKNDLLLMFNLHGKMAKFNTTVVLERNRLNEAIKTEKQIKEEKVILSNQVQTFVESLVGELPSGQASLLLQPNTCLKENDIVEISGKRYSLGEIKEVEAFSTLFCYTVQIERADSHGRTL